MCMYVCHAGKCKMSEVCRHQSTSTVHVYKHLNWRVDAYRYMQHKQLSIWCWTTWTWKQLKKDQSYTHVNVSHLRQRAVLQSVLALLWDRLYRQHVVVAVLASCKQLLVSIDISNNDNIPNLCFHQDGPEGEQRSRREWEDVYTNSFPLFFWELFSFF